MTWKLWWHERLGRFMIEQVYFYDDEDSVFLLQNASGKFVRYEPLRGDCFELIDEGDGYFAHYMLKLFNQHLTSPYG